MSTALGDREGKPDDAPIGDGGAYVELHCHSGFSMLDGASSPEALVERALALGMSSLALTDHDGLYGAVRFDTAARARGLRPILGAEITLNVERKTAIPPAQDDGPHLVLLAENRRGYANLCALISKAQLAGSKGHARAKLDWLRGHTEGLIALTGCSHGLVTSRLLANDHAGARAALDALRQLFPKDCLYVELQYHFRRQDAPLTDALAALATECDLPLVATNNAHYATREGHRLHDVLVANRHNLPLPEAKPQLRDNSEYYLKSGRQMAALFGAYPQAIANTATIAARCDVPLAFRQDALPPWPHGDGEPPNDQLSRLCWTALPQRYNPEGAPAAHDQLRHELDVIARIDLAGYFLLVYDIVCYAKERGIQVRGRGSAANSIVAYLLGITNVDPIAHDLLFERFLSAEARIMPDIDLDFCSRRREEVIQYVYERYGQDHTAMVCNYITYRTRSAMRDVGKALGLPPDLLARLSKASRGPGRYHDGAPPKEALPEGMTGHLWGLFQALCAEIRGLPRHLGIHSGGMCITRLPLVELVPLEHATMPGRVVIQWDKDSVEDAGLIKMDLLSLRTLSAIDECLELIATHRGKQVDLDALPPGDPDVYRALQTADTVGAFQVESRAQQQALVKMKPRCFGDIVVEVALIRPGPLQGNMVHPFFKRRMGLEPVTYYHPLLAPILRETLGVVVFQEQVIRIAMVMAQFSPGEADMLRRAMSRHRSDTEMAAFGERFVRGALAQGIPEETARMVFQKLSGFASYGFCKSHAASFARTAYDTLYLRAHYTAEYYCALLNNQPMGFYAPRVLIGDARRHGVEIRPIDVNCSVARCAIEDGSIRLGYSYVHGLDEAHIEPILEARQADGPFRDLADFCKRTRLPRRLVENLILSGAMDNWHRDRRRLIWNLGHMRYQEALALMPPADAVDLDPMDDAEALVREIMMTGVSANGHLMELFRERLDRAGILTSEALARTAAGSRVRIAGLVTIRQAPPTAKGFAFLTLEDEWGLMNVILNPAIVRPQRELWFHSQVLIVEGRVQRAHGQINLLAERGTDGRCF